MTDHIGRAALFHKEYLRLRTPGRVPELADVLAMANYHATMAVVDAIRGLTPSTTQDAPRCPHSNEQPEPGQVDGGKDTKPARERVDPEWIKAQRKQGWPDMHPEDYCHRCGNQNPMWCTDRDTWLTATEAWATETGREGICCFDCLAQMTPGKPPIWWIVPLPWIAQHDAERNEERTAKAEAERDAMRTRAEHAEKDALAYAARVAQAEAERDAILNKLRHLRNRVWQPDTRNTLTEIIADHTPEG